VILHSGGGLYFQNSEFVRGNPLQCINANKHTAELECGFEDRGHALINDQLFGHLEGVIEMFVIVADENTTGKGIARKIADFLPLIHDGFGSVARLRCELRLVHEQVEAPKALHSGNESGL
jgi:hypothetical protein